jgi:hypothetical protein
MKGLLKIILLLIFILFMTNCQKEENITIKNTDSYYHNFYLSGDEEGASIKVQAKHYEISELYRDEHMNVIYYYKPLVDFVGDDFVIVETYSNKTGIGAGTTRRVKLNFTITK